MITTERKAHPNALPPETIKRILEAPEVAAPALARVLGLNSETVRRVRRGETKAAQEMIAQLNGEERLMELSKDDKALTALTPEISDADIRASQERLLGMLAEQGLMDKVVKQG